MQSIKSAGNPCIRIDGFQKFYHCATSSFFGVNLAAQSLRHFYCCHIAAMKGLAIDSLPEMDIKFKALNLAAFGLIRKRQLRE